jgi:hypothetical protein
MSTPPITLSDPGQGPRPPIKRTQGLPTMDMHCMLRASGSISVKQLTRWYVVVGTHACLIIRT